MMTISINAEAFVPAYAHPRDLRGPRPSRDLPPVFRISSFVDDRAVTGKGCHDAAP
jgi:hypothetical protein